MNHNEIITAYILGYISVMYKAMRYTIENAKS